MANNARRVPVQVRLYVTLTDPITISGWSAPIKTSAQGVVALSRPGVLGVTEASGLYEPTDKVLDGWRVCVRYVSAPFDAISIAEDDYRRLRSHWRGEWRKWQEPAGPDLFIGVHPTTDGGRAIAQHRMV